MCEIVVVDPERTADVGIHQLAATLFGEQGDGFGILSVQTDGDQFTYEVYRNSVPHWYSFHQFLERTREATWRYVLHARAKTAGEVKRHHAHPIPIDCSECEAQWVIHNGSVTNHRQNRASMVSAGHSFETKVDSEVIAHKVQSLPDDVQSLDSTTYNLRGNLNYLVFFEDGILAHLTRKYYVSEDFIISCGNRRRKQPISEDYSSGMKTSYQWLRIQPDKTIEKKKRPPNRVSSYNTPRTTNTAANSSHRDSSQRSTSSANTNDDEERGLVEVYDDLIPGIRWVSAYKVAPGVVKVIDEKAESEEFVFRRDEPGLYYYYAGQEEHVDEELFDLQRIFDGDGDLRDPEEMVEENRRLSLLAQFAGSDDAEVSEAVEDSVQSTIEEIAESGEDFRNGKPENGGNEPGE